MAKHPNVDNLEKHATSIRAELKVPQQSAVFEAAVELGYLTAFADGTVDGDEREAIVRAVEILSQGAVIEWEASDLVDQCAARAEADGLSKRAVAVGTKLKELGSAEAGVYFAALVARASNGIDKKEAEVLKEAGKAAGVTPDRVRDIVKKASFES